MKKLVLHPTSTSAWQTLVKEANISCHKQLNEDLESYLVFLLMRFANEPSIVKKIIALDFLKAGNKNGKQRDLLQRDIGDNCLIFSGLFPGQARRRRVNISYFVRIGRTAYDSLAETAHMGNLLFRQLSDNFVLLMDILHCIRELDGYTQSLDLIEAEELWSDTGSLHAREILNKHCNASIFPPSSGSIQKH
ncbi:MAG: hypothetical protein HOI53_00965 [Francisellaceae bacterium]|jgi:hypothetical protein|nr:hypothetical protein [Francisellaceae bacterium]MBT6206571.1 hypothetical protein [Francisellaceae bacterium]MBT6538840.1 hypothetical protein [Francisellaceae bacterium]